MKKSYTADQLEQMYQGMTASVHVKATFITELVGGQPTDHKGIEAFVKFQLKLEDPEKVKEAVERIEREEIGERDITPELGEVKEKSVYGINVLRRTQHGAWIGDWMVKACIKAATSRLGIFVSQRGSKGNFAEAGRAHAVGISLLESDHPERIFLVGDNAYFRPFMGRVQTPQGQRSIFNHNECMGEGTTFEFEYRFIPGKIKPDELAQVMALAGNIGLGSAKAMERGKFRIDALEIDIPEPEKTRASEKTS